VRRVRLHISFASAVQKKKRFAELRFTMKYALVAFELANEKLGKPDPYPKPVACVSNCERSE
jgi:hypothetical protein